MTVSPVPTCPAQIFHLYPESVDRFHLAEFAGSTNRYRLGIGHGRWLPANDTGEPGRGTRRPSLLPVRGSPCTGTEPVNRPVRRSETASCDSGCRRRGDGETSLGSEPL